jgi:glycosyltransferase involved in cell wall biosynthesis
MTKVPLFESNTKNIVTIGRLEHIKNPLYLLELFHMLYTSDDTYRLIMVGDGSMKNVVEKYISTNELQAVVHLTGRVVDVSPYLHAADLFLLTSRAETFGRVIVEAMAAGCPVAAVNCPTGPAEIIADTVTQEVIELPCLAKFGILLSVDHMKDNCALIEQFMRSTELRKKYELV